MSNMCYLTGFAIINHQGFLFCLHHLSNSTAVFRIQESSCPTETKLKTGFLTTQKQKLWQPLFCIEIPRLRTLIWIRKSKKYFKRTLCFVCNDI